LHLRAAGLDEGKPRRNPIDAGRPEIIGGHADFARGELRKSRTLDQPLPGCRSSRAE
jgi:hypothetical protein